MQQAENEPPHAITLPHRCDSIVSALAWVFVNSQKPRIALEAGAPADAPAGGIAADSLAPRRVGALVYPIAERHVDHVVLVTGPVRHNWNSSSAKSCFGGRLR